MLSREEILLIVYFILVIVFLFGFTIVFFIVYQRRKNKLLIEKYEAEQQFKAELSNARMEIQEETLKNVSWELHDNIGQLLSVASMQLNLMSRKIQEDNKQGFSEIKTIVADSLTEVRALSRSLNNEVVDYNGLETSIRNEMERFNRLQVLEGNLEVEGEPYKLAPEQTIILFRIVQEFFSNVIKHAGASTLNVLLDYRPEEFIISVVDDGKGFDINSSKLGSGLMNMRSRANMIGAEFELNSEVGKGTSLLIKYSNTNQ